MERDCPPNRLTRREVVKAAGAGLAAMAMPGRASVAAEKQEGLAARARMNLKLAIFDAVYSDLPVEEAAARIKDDGFAGVVSDLRFKDVRFDPVEPDWGAAKKIVGALERRGLRIAALAGYYNVVDPDPARLKLGNARMDSLIANWKRLGGSPVVSLETGTCNKTNQFMEAPENYEEPAYLAVRRAFERMAREAEKTGALVAIEPYWRNIIDSARRAERLFKEVKSPSLKLTMDPCNYYRNEDLPNMGPMLEDMFRRVGGETVIAHAKDVKAAGKEQELPAAGLGVMDYPRYLRLLAGLDRELYLVVEHLKMPDVARARDFVKGQIDRL